MLLKLESAIITVNPQCASFRQIKISKKYRYILFKCVNKLNTHKEGEIYNILHFKRKFANSL